MSERRSPQSPDCAVGKHTACSGDAWDDIRERLIDCECDCHEAAA